jgi:hypothetical protein
MVIALPSASWSTACCASLYVYPKPGCTVAASGFISDRWIADLLEPGKLVSLE